MKFIKMMINVFILLFVISIGTENVFAASATINVKGNKKNVVEGETVKVTIVVTSNSDKVPLGSWEFDVKYDTSKLSLVSSNLESTTRANGVVYNSKTFSSKEYTITFKAKKAGNAKVYVTNSLVVDYDEEKPMTTTDGSATFNIITQAELEASYSKDNYLKSLKVDGYDLTPSFNKETLEYSLELENDIREIKVSATPNDSKADVDGTGKHELSEGENKITISVTAENGNVRNYIINATVKELNPIHVTVDGVDYTVVRKPENLEAPSTFVSRTTTINGEEVPAFESSITGYLIVGLKTEDGTISYFIYDDNTYTLYEERMFNGITLYVKEPIESEIPEGYVKGDLSIGGVPTVVYRSEENPYPVIYGINVQTGATNFYNLDEEEMTLQRLVIQEKVEEETTKGSYVYLVILLSISNLLLLIFLILLNVKLRKAQNKKIAL